MSKYAPKFPETVPFVCRMNEGPDWETLSELVTALRDWDWQYVAIEVLRKGQLVCFLLTRIEDPSFRHSVTPVQTEDLYRKLYDTWEELTYS